MKKLIALFLILALLPAAALASESDIVGCWANYEMLTDGAPCFTMLYLTEDHRCYFVTQAFHEDGEGLGRTYIGSWELQPDGSAIVKTGNYAETKLAFDDSYRFAISDLFGVYVNITNFTLK